VKYLWWALFIFLAFLLQGGLSILAVNPNLTVLPVYFFGIRFGRTKGLLSGVLIGALQDSLTSGMLGPHMLAKGIVGFLSASFISGNLLIWTPFLGTVAAALLTFADSTAVFFSLSLFDKLPTHPATALYTTTMQSLINAPAGIFIRPENAD
jgi:rod shape-determining protein MreD